MGHFSAMMQQARQGKTRWRLVVGSCAQDFPKMILAIY